MNRYPYEYPVGLVYDLDGDVQMEFGNVYVTAPWFSDRIPAQEFIDALHLPNNLIVVDESVTCAVDWQNVKETPDFRVEPTEEGLKVDFSHYHDN